MKHLCTLTTLLLLAVLLAACGPSEEDIATQTASAATSTAAAWTATPTRTPIPTATPAPTDTSTPTPTDTPTPTPTDTPTPTPDPSVLRLVAPSEVIDLWSAWDGKYVLYAHREAGIQEFDDLNGMDLFIALIRVGFEDVMDDAIAFMNAGGIEMNVVLQNNVPAYTAQFLESAVRVGFMVPEVAVDCGLEGDERAVRIEFEPAD